MTYSAFSHDLGITDGSKVIGMNCVRDQDGIKWQEFDDQYLAEQFFTSGASYVNTKPQRRIPLVQDTWHAGFGQEIFDSSDPKKYFSAINCDLRNKGMGILGWGSTGISTFNILNITPTWTNPTAGTGTGWGNIANAYDGNTGTEATMGGVTNAWTEWGTFTISPKYYGRTRYWVTSVAGFTSLQVSLYDGASWTNIYSASPTFGQYVTVDHTDQFASQVRVRAYVTGGPQNPILNEIACETADGGAPSGTTPAHADFNSKHYIAKGTQLLKLDAGGASFTSIAVFAANITSLVPFQVSGTDYLFIFLGTSTDYVYMTTAEAFTVSTVTDKRYQFGAWVNTTVDTMYANDGDNTIRSTVNPLNGGTAWSVVTYVGDAATAITRLVERSGALLIDKEDQPYYLDSSGNVQKDLAPEAVSGRATHSGKNSTIWQGEYFRPTGDQALLRIGTLNSWIQPSKYTTNNADFVGQVEAVVGDEEWLYIGVDNSTKVEILAGREETIDSVSSWRWHPIHELTLTGVETMWISTVYQKRLWISSTNSSDSLYYLPLPTKYGDITNDSNANFLTNGYFEVPYLHGDFKSDNKAYIKLTVTMGHSYDALIYWEAHYEKLEDSSYTKIDDLKGSATSMVDSAFIPVDGSSNDPTSTMFRLMFVGKTDDTSKTPRLLSYSVEAILYPPTGTVIACTIKDLTTFVTAKGAEKGSKSIIKTAIDNAVAATYPVTIYDIEGTSYTVKFMPLPSNVPRRYPVRKNNNEVEWFVNLLMQVIQTS